MSKERQEIKEDGFLGRKEIAKDAKEGERQRAAGEAGICGAR